MNQLHPQSSVQPKKSKKWLWFVVLPILVLAILGGLLLWWVMGGRAGDPKDVATDWLTKLSTNQVDEAYNETASDFKAGTSADQFEVFLESYPIMTNVKEAKFDSIERNTGAGNTIETLSGTLTGTDGGTSPIKIMLVAEEGDWRIYNVDLRGL